MSGWSVEVNTDKFQQAFAKFQAASKRSIAANLKQQAKLLVVDIAKRTPPGGFGETKWSRMAGEIAVKRDIAKIMRSSRSPKARTDPRRIHGEYRRSRGRVNTSLRKGGRDERFRVDAATLKIYIDQVKRRVGYMAAGWAQAARFLGASLPAWITRHSAVGYGKVNISGDDIEVDLGNRTIYSESRGLVERRASAALKTRYWAMIKRVDFAAKQAAQEAGFEATAS
jgi:hypothetical protein